MTTEMQQAQAEYEAAQEGIYAAQDAFDAADKAMRAARAELTQATQVLLLTYEHESPAE